MIKLKPGYNIKTGEKIGDIAPKVTPKYDPSINVLDDDYVTDIHGDNKINNHSKLDMNIYTVNGIPSRWEHNKKHSSWHFNNQIDPSTDTKAYDILCVFKGDWSEAIKIVMEEAHEETICNYRPRDRSQQDKDLHDAEMMDVRVGAGGMQEDVSCCYMYNIYNMRKSGKFVKETRPEFEVFFKMAEELGIDPHQMRINCQMLGQMTPMHIDMAMRYNAPYWRKKWKEGGGDTNPDMLRRVLINLLDWDFGQHWLFGSHAYSHYPAGEALTFDAWNAPHGTANMGYSPRVTLQITGFISDKTRDFINNGGRHKVVDLS